MVPSVAAATDLPSSGLAKDNRFVLLDAMLEASPPAIDSVWVGKRRSVGSKLG